MPHKPQQRGKPRSQSVGLPATINKDKRASVVTNSVAQNKTTKKAGVSCAKERTAKPPKNDINQPSTGARLPSVVMSLPEKVAISYLHSAVMFVVAGSENIAGNGTEDEQ